MSGFCQHPVGSKVEPGCYSHAAVATGNGHYCAFSPIRNSYPHGDLGPLAAYGDLAAYTNPDTHTYTHLYPHIHSHANDHSYTNTVADPYGYRDSYQNYDAYAYNNTYSYSNAHSDAYGHFNANAYITIANRYANTACPYTDLANTYYCHYQDANALAVAVKGAQV